MEGAMEAYKRLEFFSVQSDAITAGAGHDTWLPPWVFKHDDLVQAVEGAQKVAQDALTNIINHIHFTEGVVRVLLHHLEYNESLLLNAYPQSSTGKTITCHWENKDFVGLDLEGLEFKYLILDDGRSMIMVPAFLKEMSREFFVLELPEEGYAIGQRQAKRYACREVAAELIQNGFHAEGELMDFSPVGLRIRVRPDPSCSFRWFNSEDTAVIHLRRDSKILFSGSCRMIRQRGQSSEKELVFVPLNGEIKRFKKKHIRNVRQRLAPAPSLSFFHPFLGRKVQFEVEDISTSGFCVREAVDERVLLPGMIIPEATLGFVGFLKVKCSAQVIYCKVCEGKEIRCGLAILDMDIQAYSSLTHILTRAMDPHAYVSTEVDMDALWEFFFETGFLYPKKYRLIQPQRAQFKETYKKLYQDNPEIARHFTYQRNGRIFGHISMVRAYERTWMIHHHAAKAMENKRTGFMVLKQIMHYLNDMHRLPSACIDYTICYFRPENKFPDRVFGGFARELNNPRGCSLDLFAYLPHTRLSLGNKLPDDWSLTQSTDRDLWEFEHYYMSRSGGLLLDAMGLRYTGVGQSSLQETYRQMGLTRSCQTYSLKSGEKLHAILVVNHSDLGFNLSELLNGIKVLVANPKALPWSVLSVAISQLTGEFQMERVPILFYPTSYVEEKEIPYEKYYQMWVLNVQHGNEYLEYMQKKFRISYK
jgi:hypothetical protein